MIPGEPIVISGLGAVSGFGRGVEPFWAGLCAGQSAIRGPWAGGGAHPVAAVPADCAFDGTSTTLARWAAAEAVAGGVDPVGLAVVGASTTGDMGQGERAFAEDRREGGAVHPEHLLWHQLSHRPAAAVRDALGATGPCFTVSTACTSGAVAVGAAFDLIRLGRARRALVVGADALCHTTVHGFAALSASAPTPCRPFDRSREGMSLGEGAAALLIEPRSLAEQAGRPIFAALLGWATRADAVHLTAPDPEGAGARAVIAAALAGRPAAALDVICAHGTGTPLNDAMEAGVFAALVPQGARSPAIFGTKGAVGHTLGAAGAMELVATALVLHREVVPPTVGLVDPEFEGDFVRALRPGRVSLALSVNFAFGGHDVAVLVGRCA